MAYKEVGINFDDVWNALQKGDFIEGIYQMKSEDVGTNKSNLYTLEQKENKLIYVWGSTVLDSKINFIKIGDKIKITYLGMVEGKSYKDFKVEVDK